MSGYRHERLLEEGLLEEVEVASEAIVALWERAIEEWRGARAGARLSNTIRARLAYTAGFQLATAILRASGLRVRGSAGRHHWATFYALRGFDDSDLDRWGAAFDGHRELRHRALYEPEARVVADEWDRLKEDVAAFFDDARRHIVERIPEIEDRLTVP